MPKALLEARRFYWRTGRVLGIMGARGNPLEKAWCTMWGFSYRTQMNLAEHPESNVGGRCGCMAVWPCVPE
jgi:hypothetical protein